MDVLLCARLRRGQLVRRFVCRRFEHWVRVVAADVRAVDADGRLRNVALDAAVCELALDRRGDRLVRGHDLRLDESDASADGLVLNGLRRGELERRERRERVGGGCCVLVVSRSFAVRGLCEGARGV